MTATQEATIAACDLVIHATQAHIAAEPPAALLEIIDQIEKDLRAIPVFIGREWKLVKLAILRSKTEERLTEKTG